MKTIAQQLNIKEFPFMIKDKQGGILYLENSNGYWCKREYNKQGREIYFENSGGFWTKQEHDEQGNRLYFENSDGIIEDNREEIIELNGIKYKRI